jgi:hypothetical protein
MEETDRRGLNQDCRDNKEAEDHQRSRSEADADADAETLQLAARGRDGRDVDVSLQMRPGICLRICRLADQRQSRAVGEVDGGRIHFCDRVDRE